LCYHRSSILADSNAIFYSNTGNFGRRETANGPRVHGSSLSHRSLAVIGAAGSDFV